MNRNMPSLYTVTGVKKVKLDSVIKILALAEKRCSERWFAMPLSVREEAFIVLC